MQDPIHRRRDHHRGAHPLVTASPPSAPQPRRRARRPLWLVAGLLIAVVVAACGDGQDPAPGGGTEPGNVPPEGAELSIAIASFDLAVGSDQRLLAGIFGADRALLAFGEVTFELGYLGDEASGEVQLEQQTTASYLPIPGMEPDGDDEMPRFLDGEPGNGVYAGRVDLDQPGNWGLRVVAETADGEVLEGQAVFPVQEEHQVHTVGSDAPRTVNPTIADAEAGDIDPAAIDSRAGGADGTIPDQHLHDRVIAEELDAGRPIVVAVTTPVYCVSRFCGPLTDELADLAHEYEDVASFVHLEVWKDHGEQEVNEAAAEWILPSSGAGGNEPWVFLVDADGVITARWDNVLDVEELEDLLAEL
jgi:hypothetical protein